MTTAKSIPSVSVTYARTGRTARSNELGIRPIQERAWEKRGHRRSREDDRCEFLGRAAQSLRLLDGLDRPASVFRRCRPVIPR